MTRYKVALTQEIRQTIEIVVDADSEAEAIKKAMQDYDRPQPPHVERVHNSNAVVLEELEDVIGPEMTATELLIKNSLEAEIKEAKPTTPEELVDTPTKKKKKEKK